MPFYRKESLHLALWRVLEETSGSAEPRRSSTRHRKQTEQGGTQSARERAFAAEPVGDPPVFSVRQAMSFNAMLYAVFNCNWQRLLDTLKVKQRNKKKPKTTFTQSGSF